MMRKYLVSFILGLFFIAVNGNPLTFHPRYVNSYQFSATDVWNLDVQFTGAAKLNIYMIAIVSAKGSQFVQLKVALSNWSQAHKAIQLQQLIPHCSHTTVKQLRILRVLRGHFRVVHTLFVTMRIV